MRKTIHISKNFLLFLVIFIAGIAFATYGIHSIQKENNAIEFNELDEDDCMKGQYVKGEIPSCVRKNIGNLGNGSTSAISQELIVGLTEYAFFTIPIKESKYIQLMISDKDIIEALENDVENIYFEGEIIESPIGVNDKWYEDLSDSDAFNTDNVLPEYVIQEVRFEQRKECVYAGLTLVIVALILYLRKNRRIRKCQNH